MNTYPKYGKSNDMNMPLNSYGMNVMLNNSFSKLLFDIINVDKISHICTKEVLNNEINNVIGQFKNLTTTSLDAPILVDISEVFNNIDLKYIKSRPISCDNYSPLCGVISSNNPKDIIATDIKINSEKIYNMTLVLSEKYDFKLIMDPLFDNRVTGLPIYLCILKDSYKLVISNSTNVLIITKYKNQDRFAYVIYTVSDGKHAMSESYTDYSHSYPYNTEELVSKSTEFYSYDEEDEETDIEYKHNVVTTNYSHDISKGFDYKDPRYMNLTNMNSRIKNNYVKTIMDASDIGSDLVNVADIMVNSDDDSTVIKYEIIKNNTTIFYDSDNKDKKDLTDYKNIVKNLIDECNSIINKDPNLHYSGGLKETKLYRESTVEEILLSETTDIKYITITKLTTEKVSSDSEEGTSTNTMALAIRVVYYINDNIAELIVYHAKDRFKSWLSSTIELGNDKDTSHSYSIVNTKYKGFSGPDIVRSFILTDDTTNNLIKSITYSVHLLNSKTLNLYDIPNKLVYCTKVGEDKFTVADMENIIVLKNKISSSKEIIVRDLK
jgi:hypothetical protein